MIKKQSSQQKIIKGNTKSPQNTPQNKPKNNLTEIELSRNNFLTWARKLATEQRYVALRINMPQICQFYRNICKKIYDTYQKNCSQLKKPIGRSLKILQEPYQTFLDSVMFMTDKDYLDSIGYEYNYVDQPEKIYDLLLRVRNNKQKKVQYNSKNQANKQMLKNIAQLEQWVIETVEVVWNSLKNKINSQWNKKLIEDQKNQKRNFVSFWKGLSEDSKQKFLRFDYKDQRDFQKQLKNMEIYLRNHEMELQISCLMKAERKQLCNKIFKWKAKKVNPQLCSYYQKIFSQWKKIEKTTKSKKKYRGRPRGCKKNKRPRSIDVFSTQTNETEFQAAKFQFDSKAITIEKFERDIYKYTDEVSSAANSYFQRRVLAFERLKYLLSFYGINIKLYGSCASGISIENSDLDVVVNGEILLMFGYAQNPQKQVQQALLYIEQILYSVIFTSEINLIGSAYIPIIKFQIDTTQQFQCQDPNLHTYLNRSISLGGSVQIDLSIQTKSHSAQGVPTYLPQHLGVTSTNQISKWLDQNSILRPILLILKRQITLHKLHETFNKGLNTYTLVVMLVSAYRELGLQKQQKIGIIMQKIIKFWGFQFDPKVTGVYLSENNQQNDQVFYSKKDWKIKQKVHQTNFKRAEFEVRDPFNKQNFLTKNCYKFNEVQELFRKIYHKCILKTQQKVEEICSPWNIKHEKLNPEQISEWVLGQLKQNEFDRLLQ